MKSLTIWSLSDGRPGHYNQTKGLVKALEQLFHVDSHWVDSKLLAGSISRPLLKGCINSSPSTVFYLAKCFYRINLPKKPPDLIVSAGGNTIFLNIALARFYKCKNFFIGRLHNYSAKHFTAYLTIKQSRDKNAIQVSLAPTTIDKTEVDKLQCRARSAYKSERELWALAIGGDSGIYRYTSKDWANMIELMNRISHHFGIDWLITTSRRTGAKAESFIRKHLDPNAIADSVWYSSLPRQVMKNYIAAASVVVCTEDSFTMLTEAASSGKPVISLRPDHATPHDHYDYALGNLIQRKLVTSVLLSDYNLEDLANSIDKLTPIQESVSEIVSQQLRTYF